MKIFKIITSTLLTVCILSFSGGLSLVKHYCGTTLKHTAINHGGTKCCDDSNTLNNGFSFEKTCCVDEINFLKTSEFHKDVVFQFIFFNSYNDINNDAFVPLLKKVNNYKNYEIPPPKLAVFKQVNSYLI